MRYVGRILTVNVWNLTECLDTDCECLDTNCKCLDTNCECLDTNCEGILIYHLTLLILGTDLLTYEVWVLSIRVL